MKTATLKAYEKGTIVTKEVEPELVEKVNKFKELFGNFPLYWHEFKEFKNNTIVVHVGNMATGKVYIRAEGYCKFYGN